MKKLFFSIGFLFAMILLIGCEANELESTVSLSELEKLVDYFQSDESPLTGEESMEIYRQLNEDQLSEFFMKLTPVDDPGYAHDVDFRKNALLKSKEIFNKPFNQLTFEEEEFVFDQLDAGALLFGEGVNETTEIEDRNPEPSWCVSYTFPDYLNYAWNGSIDWNHWSYIARIEGNVTSSDCDVRFVYDTTLHGLRVGGFFGRTTKYSGGQTWHFVGLGRLNAWYGCNPHNWLRNRGRT